MSPLFPHVTVAESIVSGWTTKGKLVCYIEFVNRKWGYNMTLEQELLQVVTGQLKASIHKMDMVQLPYNKRFELPQDFMRQAWSLIDKDELLKCLSDRLQVELVDRLVNAFAAEISTDIKQVLSVKERREAIRSLVRDNIDSICK